MKPTEAIGHPKDWSTAKIGSSVDFLRGISWTKGQEHSTPGKGRVPVIRIGNVQERLILDDLLYVSGLKASAVARKRVGPGWSVVVGSNGNRNRVGNAVLIKDGAEYVFASFLMALHPKVDSGVTPEYFFRWLCSEPVQAQLGATAEGTTGLNNLSQSFFRSMVVGYPDADQQAAIAHILDAVDTAIERARAAAERARVTHRSVLHELLDRGLWNKRTGKNKRPSNWRMRRVDEVAEVGSGVTLGKDVSGFKSVELPYLRVANVQDGFLDLSEVKTVRVRVDEVDRYRLDAGDVLMTEGGDIDKLGRGAIWEGQIPDCLHQNHIFRIRANKDVLMPEFYALVVESDYAKRYFMRVAKRTTNLASTNKTQVRAFRFPVPNDLNEQRDIVSVMKAVKAKTNGLVGKEAALRALKRALMHDLLSGRVCVDVSKFGVCHE